MLSDYTFSYVKTADYFLIAVFGLLGTAIVYLTLQILFRIADWFYNLIGSD
jgi:hypothetical protein